MTHAIYHGVSELSEAQVCAKDRDRLIQRLLKGQAWLVATHNKLLSLPNLGLGSRMEAQFLFGLDTWDQLDNLLRQVYNYRDCIYGPDQRCPGNAIVSCQGYVGR